MTDLNYVRFHGRVRSRSLGAFTGLLCAVAMAFFPTDARAQRPDLDPRDLPESRTPRTPNTHVSVELLTGNDGTGQRAHQWHQVFEQLNVSVLIRQRTAFDKVETRETSQGRLRNVTAIGEIVRNGDIAFADRTFSLGDPNKLGEWIGDLQKYGAQGSPETQPMWGLSKDQFTAVYTALSEPVETEVKGMTLERALSEMNLPEEFRLQMRIAAKERLGTDGGRAPVRQSLKGVSKGTALAILLSEYGLGFRPERMPDASIELAIEPRDAGPVLWPIGWEFTDLRHRNQRAADLYKLVPVELEPISLKSVLDAISVKAQVPIFYDYTKIDARGVDLEEVQVSQRSSKMSYSQLIQNVVGKAMLKREVLRDEKDMPLVWITAVDLKRNR